jgi:hypothetical protein
MQLKMPTVELAPGLWHWTSPHPRIHVPVSSYYLAAERVMIDALVPPEGLGWFDEIGRPEHFVLSNRHHDRGAWEFRDAFGVTVHCVRNGLHELEGRGPAEGFDFGDELPGGIRVNEIGAICPDECALYVPAHAALACADGVVRMGDGGSLGFVPDSLMDEPEETKRRLRAAYRDLLDLDFDNVLLAHGEPVLGDGKEALREFAAGGA